MTRDDARAGARATTGGQRRWVPWIFVAAVLGGVIGGALAARVTPVYTSEMLIGVAPPPLPESLVSSTVGFEIGTVADMVSQQIKSRTRLERLIKEFDLYKDERRRDILENIVEHMRNSIAIDVIERGDAVVYRVTFVGTEPQTVMKVTERLAALFIKEHEEDRHLLAQSTQAFLTDSLEETRRRLVERHAQLRAAREKRQPEAETLAIEYEVLQTTYKDLSFKVEESRIAADVEGTGRGAQLRVIEGARVPERPIAPDWRKYLGAGAGSGAVMGGLVLLLGATRPVRRHDQTLDAELSASDDNPAASN